MHLQKPAQHLFATHRNWLLLHVIYIILLLATFFAWGLIGAMYFAMKFPQFWANIGFIAYGAAIVSFPALIIHIRAGYTYSGTWRWRWSVIAQLLYYVVSAVAMMLVMLWITYM